MLLQRSSWSQIRGAFGLLFLIDIFLVCACVYFFSHPFFASYLVSLLVLVTLVHLIFSALLLRIIKASRQQLDDTQRVASVGSWEWELDGDSIQWSDELCRIFGVDPKNFNTNYKEVIQRILPEDRERVDQTVQAALREKQAFDLTHRILTPDGVIRILHAHGQAVLNKAGKPVRMIGTCQDITLLKEAEFKVLKVHQELAHQIQGRALELTQANQRIKNELAERQRAEKMLRERAEKLFVNQNALLEIVKMDVSDLPRTLEMITEFDAKLLGVDRVSIWFFNPEHTQIVCQDLYSLSTNAHEKGAKLLAKDYPTYFRCLEEKFVVVANSALTDPQVREFAADYLVPLGIQSMMDVPIWLEGKLIGIICHEHTGLKRDWTLEEQEFAASIGHIISISLSVSERIKAEEKLVKTNEELRLLNETRLAFTSMVSHELRTPLTSIKAGLDMILSGIGGTLSEDQTETLSIAKNNVDRLSRMIDNILDFSRLEAGKMEFLIQETNLNALMEEIYSLMKLETENKGITLSVELPEKPVIASCDVDKMKTVVINLVHNASKFTTVGGSIRMRLRQADESNAELEVEDTGIGIEQGVQARIFQMFNQGDRRGMMHSGGSGIGLAVCKFIVEQHGGTILLVSAPNEGSKFTVRIPLHPKESRPPYRAA